MSWEDNYQVWANKTDLPKNLQTNLEQMANDDAAKEDAFYAPLSFGTAGMRGLLGAGINRMNIYTVRQATEGLARLIDSLNDESIKARGVAISYDSRHFSAEFASEAGRVLGAHGIKAYVFEALRPTPELSFAVRYLHAYAGIMITASHNPKAYNGYKIYGEDGGQMPPKESDIITESIRQANMFDVPVGELEQLKSAGLYQVIGQVVDDAYLAELKTVSVDQKLINTVGKDMKLIYSPLHGTGALIAGQALRNAGFENVMMVPEQMAPNGDFPTVELPNPEAPEALAMGIELAKKEKADVVIAVDPDADRMGTAVRQPSGDYVLLTGNQIGAVLMHYLLTAKRATGTLPENGVLVKSIVSSEFAANIAESFGVETINVLTGFKYIAEQIQNYEQTAAHTFLFGFEESYGYLVKPFVRDKDSIQATVLMAEVAAYYKSLGKTVYDGVQELFQQYGYFVENTKSLTFAGVDGKDKIAALIAKFRAQTPAQFGGIEVVRVEDFANATDKDVATGQVTQITLPKAEVLKYWLSDGSWVAVRPSGTEPKIKFYVGTKGETEQVANDKLAAIQATISEYID
ncbi:phospho-sugar mutase [Weissella diestrammenae]|uniref:Phosphoglucomutase n=1 Tax=Weissella diestrammenae TaxID=1162633 RepID=A0A7G9T527_9LACO|nr:phospho-sugar mutase [Weissella diestrammenae]MCM0583055.1 phospho-sugar mutase [Weissella diestrammenae]QNN75202.1 phospho-sugar mutase [Weissella diestrammenae]